jgi:hypothetical protein
MYKNAFLNTVERLKQDAIFIYEIFFVIKIVLSTFPEETLYKIILCDALFHWKKAFSAVFQTFN